MRVVVVGAGIGGLAAAVALRKVGIGLSSNVPPAFARSVRVFQFGQTQ